MPRDYGDVEARVRARLDAGDIERATEEVIRGLGADVYGYLVRVLGEDDSADDVFSAVTFRLWRGIGKFRWDTKLCRWVYRIARNELVRYGQSPHVRRAEHASTGRLEELMRTVRAETLSSIQGKRDRVDRLVARLPPEDRELLVLRIDRELPFREIASILLGDDVSPDGLEREESRLRQRLQTIKRRLREGLKDDEDPHPEPPR